MGIQGMKVHHHFPRGFWPEHQPPPTTLRCKRLRPLAPKLAASATHLKSFIRPSKPSSPPSYHHSKEPSPHKVESGQQAGGTRWNPTQEQIRYLEMLYRSGIRTPNAQQIEHITAHLGKYGKIEGKNVFYWFQNHKARERQKQKRISMENSFVSTTPKTLPPILTSTRLVSSPIEGEVAEEESRNCTGGGEGEIRTLELFPLHPEGRS